MSREVENLNRRLLRARDAMDRAYAEPLDVRAVAAVAHILPAHFSRCFRSVFGGGAGPRPPEHDNKPPPLGAPAQLAVGAPESCAPLARLNRRGLASRSDLAGRFALGQAASLANCRRGPR